MKQSERVEVNSMECRKVVLLDREGVISRRIPNGYVTSWERFSFLPNATDAICQLSRQGYHVLVVSNQAGVGKGLMSLQALKDITHKFVQHIESAGGSISAVYYCTHRAEDGCDCRKPKPGLLLNAQSDYRFDPAQTFMVGDTESDIAAATRAGCPAILVSSSKRAKWRAWEYQPVAVVPNLMAAAAYILAHSSRSRN